MTAERVDMATPDNLLFLDTDAVNSSLASPLIEQNKPTRATDNQTDDSLSSVPDQHPDPDSGSSGLMPVLCQDGTIEIHYTNSERENESGLVLTQPLDHTAMIEITKNNPNNDKSDNCDLSTAAVMETDSITNSTNIPNLIHLLDRNQNDKHGISNTKEDPNEAHGTLTSPSLTEHNRQDEMSQDTILTQYTSFESIGLDVNPMANDDDPLVNTVSNVINGASNESDATSSETLIQTCQDTSEGVNVAVEAATVHKAHPEIHQIAEDLTCCGFTTSHVHKTEDPKTGVHLSVADLHEVDTLGLLKHASEVLDFFGLNINVLETADWLVNDSEIIQTVNQDLASSNVEFCTGALTQIVPNLLQDSEHNGMESESNRTEDSMLDSMIETKFPLDVSRVQPFATETTDNSIFHHSMLKTSQIGGKQEKDLSQVIPCPTPVMKRDLGKCSEEIGGACLKITRMERDVEAGSELWLDARQFLAGEEDERAIFDKRGHSCSPSPTTTLPDKTKASYYSRTNSIDHHTEDWELRFPPVERWSSSDSWASALSDWFQAVNTYSEDSLNSTNTSSTGPKHAMAIQDNILEQRTSSNKANNTGETCLNLLEPEEPGQALSRGLVESDNTNGTLFKQADKDGLPSHSDSDRQDNTTMENNTSLLERSESNKPDAAMHMLNASKSPANEASAKLYGTLQIPGELWSTKVRWLAHF